MNNDEELEHLFDDLDLVGELERERAEENRLNRELESALDLRDFVQDHAREQVARDALIDGLVIDLTNLDQNL
jgi:hypothetical protein